MGITAPGSVWEKHAAFWSEQFRCLLPDNRGVGGTDKPAGPYTSAMMADDFAGLLDHLGLAQVRVVGCSMGSIIAQQLALRHPQRVRSLVLMCPWARCDAYARGIFEHMKAIKARLRPEEFTTYIQLLIFSKATWDDPQALADFLTAGAKPPRTRNRSRCTRWRRRRLPARRTMPWLNWAGSTARRL